jgi:tryptophan 2-monooxygenase
MQTPNKNAKHQAHQRYLRDFDTSRGSIHSLDFLFDTEACCPTQHPANPFDFIGLFNDPGKYIQLSPQALGQEVAIIGGGSAGVAAANILMRLGLKPIVYELNHIGGRTFTGTFKKDPNALMELGAMRIPKSQKLVFELLERWGISYKPFPNPLVADTVIDVYGKQAFYDAAEGRYTQGPRELIEAISRVKTLYKALVQPIIAQWNATQHDLDMRTTYWSSLVDIYNKKSLYEVLVEFGWSTEQIQLFGYIGIGSGGFDSLFGASFLEIIRIEIQQLETDQQLIISGTQQIPERLWTEQVDCRHWGRMSVKELNGGAPRGGVLSIRTPPPGESGPIEVVDTSHHKAMYPTVILTASPRAIDMTMDINPEAFSVEVWNALRNLELVASEKVFALTKTAFWNDAGEKHKLYTTLTDQPPRQMYLFDATDFGRPTNSGVICLSYAWASSSIRFNALPEERRKEVCLEAIAKMKFYGPSMRRKLEEEIVETASICWEQKYGFNGGWRMANPGQADQVRVLHEQCLGLSAERNNGLYLAGEAMSWYGLSGWIDGALKTGAQAALSSVRRLNSLGA